MNFFNKNNNDEEIEKQTLVDDNSIEDTKSDVGKPSIQSEPCSFDEIDPTFFEESEDEAYGENFNRDSLFANPYADEKASFDENNQDSANPKTEDMTEESIIDEDNDSKVEEDETSDPSDDEIYADLFSETTIVGTQIYSKEIDDSLGSFNYSSNHSYRVGYESNDIGAIFTITKKDFQKPFSFSRAHSESDIDWYNELAGQGNSFAAVKGTTVQGIAICEPQLWNNTLNLLFITVAKDSRKQGVGNMLLEHCVQYAREHGYRAVCVEVLSKNGYAVDFFKKRYFNIVGTNIQLYTNSDLLKGDVGIFMQRTII